MFLGSLRFCGKSIYIAKKCLVFNSQRMKGMGLLFRKCSFLSPLCGFRTGITGLQKVRQCDHGRVHFLGSEQSGWQRRSIAGRKEEISKETRAYKPFLRISAG